MPSPTEQALITLIPTRNNLPPELINLAEALLNQSRLKAATLKPDEEIGRIYACANIACERLKLRLSLPQPKPAPPVPPRVYKRLYTFLDGVLSAPSTPKTNRYVDALNPSTPRSSTKVTPTSGRGAAGRGSAHSRTAGTGIAAVTNDDSPSHRAEKRTRTPSAKVLETGTTASGTKRRKLNGGSAVPEWTAAVATRLGEEFGEARAPAAVRDGLDAIVALRGLRYPPDAHEGQKRDPVQAHVGSEVEDGDDEKLDAADLPPLMVVLALYIVARLRGRQVGDKEFVAMRRKAMDVAMEVEEARIASEEYMLEATRRFVKAAGEEGWTEMEWFTSLDSAAGADVGNEAGVTALVDTPDTDDDGDELGVRAVNSRRKRLPDKTPLRRGEKHAPRPLDGGPEDTASGLLPGLGTMFQDAVDWLSEERREAYRVWKADILRRIELQERQAA